jgi:hypothetical protein
MVGEEENVDYQLGAADVNQSAVADGEFVPFKMESRVVFSTLAEDIYPSPKVGIREAITNAITATMKVEDDDYEPIINISVDGTNNRPELIIEDNGVGMTMETIREVVSYIGRSTVRDDYQKAGQFGMGFLALFSLCGTSGGFIMHTNARTEYGEPISGAWKDGGFSRFDEDTTRAKEMDGTRFEIILRDGIDIEEIREWVKDIAQWSRVSILYEDKTGNGVHSDEFGVSKIDSLVPDDSISVKVDNKYYTAISSPDLIDTPTVLLDVLIERNKDYIPHLPFDDLAIRLKSEHPVVMSGKYEGKMVIRDVEYEQIPEDRKDMYVPERKVDSDTSVTPSPTGTREKLNENDEFWKEVGLSLKQKYEDISENIIRNIVEESLSEINIDEWKFIEDSLFNNLDNYKRFDSFLKSKYPSIYSPHMSEKIYGLLQSVETYSYNPNTKSTVNKGEKKIYTILNDFDYNFMFISKVNHKKAMRIHLSDDSYIFIKIPKSNWYDFYENILGWDRVKNVDNSHPICENINRENIEELNQTDNLKSKKVTNDKDTVSIHVDGNPSHRSIDVEDIVGKIDTKGDEYILALDDFEIEKLIVFPASSNYKINNYSWIKSNKQALVRTSTKKITNEIMNIPVSISIDDVIESAENIDLLTSEGMKYSKDISFEDSIIHVVPDATYDIISNEENADKMLTLFDENKFDSINLPHKIQYIPIRESTLYDILPLVKQSIVVKTGDLNIPIDGVINGPSTAQCKLYMLEFNNRDVDIIKEIDEKICSNKPLTGVRISIISLLDKIANEDIDLSEVSINE